MVISFLAFTYIKSRSFSLEVKGETSDGNSTETSSPP